MDRYINYNTYTHTDLSINSVFFFWVELNPYIFRIPPITSNPGRFSVASEAADSIDDWLKFAAGSGTLGISAHLNMGKNGINGG